MKIALQSEPRENARFFVRISEFSFAAYSVQINHVFRCLPRSEIESHNLRQHEIIQRILHRLVGFLLTPGFSPVAAKASDESLLNGFRPRLHAAEAARSSSAAIPTGLKLGVNETTVKHPV
jgi:hypothetical protein